MKPMIIVAGVLLFALTAGCASKPRFFQTQSEREETERQSPEYKAKQAELKAKREAQKAADEKRRAAAVEAYLAADGANRPPQIAAAIRSGDTIMIGMTKEEFLFVMPKPDTVNSTVSSYGRREQWVYRFRYEYYYFENDVLKSWQSSR